MGNRSDDHSPTVANPGPSGVFLFPDARTFNVPAFSPFRPLPGRPKAFSCATHDKLFPGRPGASLVIPGGRRGPSGRSLIPGRRCAVDPFPSVGRSDPFPAVPGRRPVRSVLSLPLSRSTSVLAVLIPFCAVDPDGRRMVNPGPTVDDGRSDDPDGRRRRSETPDGRTERSDDPGRRPTTTPDDGRTVEWEGGLPES